MSTYCHNCGSPLEKNAQFCVKCGTRITAPQQAAVQPSAPPYAPAYSAQPKPGQPSAQSPQPPQNDPYRPAPPPYHGGPAAKPPKKSRLGLMLGIVLGVIVVAAAVVVILVTTRKNEPVAVSSPKPGTTASATPSGAKAVQLTPFPAELVVDATKVNVTCDYDAPEFIIPANYRSMDDVVFMQLSADRGSTDILVQVEIPGFTQKYEQKITVTRAETELRIHPPLVDGVAKTLNSAKDGQINITVTDLNTNKLIVKDTKPVKLYSRYDMQWVGEDGTPYDENILAWMTPEAQEVRTLLRLSADACKQLTNGQLDSIVGYQEAVKGWSHDEITYVQAYCIMHTLAHELGVKYVMSPFSSTSATLQRIATPAEVINSAGGLCVETSVTIASALQAMNMHAVLILLPGHCQVAVETWRGSGKYLLIETTALTSAANAKTQDDFNSVILPHPITTEEWNKYLGQKGVVAIDCDMGEELHIQSIG